jgi:hypothetical protein
MRVGILGEPRPVPRRSMPILAGGLAILIMLPVFVLAGWPLNAWGIAGLVWIGWQGLGVLLSRIKPSPSNPAASGVLAFAMMARLLALLAVFVAVAASDADLGLAVALVWGLAYTVELAVSLAEYYNQEPTA